MNLNQVQLIGRVGGDPEVKSIPSGRLVCSFSLATNRKWKDKDGKASEVTTWHNVVIWGDSLIEKVIVPYVKKGSELYVGGRIETRSWEKDGVKHYRTEIIGEDISLGSSPKGGDRDDRPARSSAKKGNDFDDYEDKSRPANAGGDGSDINPDDIPF